MASILSHRYLRKNVLTMIIVFTLNYLCMNQQKQFMPYRFSDAFQLPGSKQQLPYDFYLRNGDDILILNYFETNSTSNQLVNRFESYYDFNYRNKISNYTLQSQQNITHFAVTDSGVYVLESKSKDNVSFTNNRILSKYPTYTNWTLKNSFNILNLYQLSSPLLIDDKNIAFTITSPSNCPSICLWNYIYDFRLLKLYQSVKSPLRYQTNCTVNDDQRQIFDIGGNMIALKTDYSVFILQRTNLTNVLQKISIRKKNNYATLLKILDLTTYQNKKINKKTLTIQVGSLSNYYIFTFNQQTQLFDFTSELFNPTTKCLFYNDQTCISFLGNEIVLNENINNQRIKNFYTQKNNPFEGLEIFDVSSDEVYLAGWNEAKQSIKILGVKSNNEFYILQSIDINPINDSTKIIEIKQIQFIQQNNKATSLIIKGSLQSYSGYSYTTICQLNFYSIKSLKCLNIQNINNQIVDFVYVRNIGQQQLNRIITVKKQPQKNGYIIQSRLFSDKDNKQSFDKESFIEEKLDNNLQYNNIKIVHNSQYKQQFVLVFQMSNNQPIVAITYKIVIQLATNKTIIQKVSLNHKFSPNLQIENNFVSFKQYIAVLTPVDQEGNQCTIKIFDRQLKQVPTTGQNPYYEKCNFGQNYILISQQNYTKLIVERQFDKNGVCILDFLSIQKDQLTQKIFMNSKSMFRQRFQNSDFYKNKKTKFILPNKNVLVDYKYLSSNVTFNQTVTIYNIETIPLTIRNLEQQGQQFNFSQYSQNYKQQFVMTKLNNKNSQQQQKTTITFTIMNQLKIIDNFIVQNSKDIRLVDKVQVQSYKIYQQKQGQQVIDTSRTKHTPSNDLVLSILSTNTSQSRIILTSINSLNKGQVNKQIVNVQQRVKQVYLSPHGQLIIFKNKDINIITYNYQIQLPIESQFKNIFFTQDEKMTYVKSTINNNIGYYKQFVMSFQQRKIIESIDLIDLRLSQSGYTFIAQLKDKIITIDNQTLQIKNQLKKSSINSTINQWYFIDIKLNNNITEQALILKLSDTLVWYDKTLTKSHIIANITNTTLIAIGQNGTIAYVQSLPEFRLQNKFNIIQLRQFGKNYYQQPFHLPIKTFRQFINKQYQPIIKNIHFSVTNTLLILTSDFNQNNKTTQNVNENNKAYRNLQQTISSLSSTTPKQVFFKYQSIKCLYHQQIDNNTAECKCKKNYTYISSYIQKSLFDELSCSCQNYFIQRKDQCICPESFTYSQSNEGSFCQCNGIAISWMTWTICKPYFQMILIILGIITGLILLVSFICYCCKIFSRGRMKSKTLITSVDYSDSYEQ